MEQAIQLLLVDDDSKFCLLTKNYLSGQGFDVTCVHEGAAAIEAAVSGTWDAIILDVMLPGLDGYQVLRCVRSNCDVPILLISGLGDQETERIVGLELGADDYVSKSFSPRELLARLNAVLRRNRRVVSRTEEIIVGGLTINVFTRVVSMDGKRIALTPIEFELLLAFAQSKGNVRTRRELVQAVGERNFGASDRSVDVHVSALRKKLHDNSKNPRFIRTIRSLGYIMLNPENK